MSTVTIDELEYLELQLRDLELSILENAGVDNWSGCGECEDEELLEMRSELENKINEIQKERNND